MPSNGKFKLEAKEEIRKRTGESPDWSDTLCLINEGYRWYLKPENDGKFRQRFEARQPEWARKRVEEQMAAEIGGYF